MPGSARRVLPRLGRLDWPRPYRAPTRASCSLTWTDVQGPHPAEDESFVGALVGGEYKWQINDHAAFGQRVTWFPNFESGSDWRLESFTSLESTPNEWLALRFGYDLRFQNEPIPGRDDTDATARVSVVVNL